MSTLSTGPFTSQAVSSDEMAEPNAPTLHVEFVPGPESRPFDRQPFLLPLCPPSSGLRARWAGRRWLNDPTGREVLMRVVLMETVSGAFYVAAMRLEPDAVPTIVRLGALTPDLPTFTTGPTDAFGTGDGVCLTVGPCEEFDQPDQSAFCKTTR